jgi:DNA-binding NarL/FixJ family response regulator
MLAGACGFLNKAGPAEVILRAIECVQQGQIWLDRSTTAKVVASFYDRANKGAVLDDQPALTPAERKIVAAVAKYKGSPNKVIADVLHISAHTLRNHLASYGKLGLHKD